MDDGDYLDLDKVLSISMVFLIFEQMLGLDGGGANICNKISI